MLPLHVLPSSAGIRICGWYIFSPGGRLAKRVATSSQSLLNHALAKTCARILVASRVLTNWPMERESVARVEKQAYAATDDDVQPATIRPVPSAVQKRSLLVHYIRCSFKALGILSSFIVWHHHGSSWPSLCQDFSECSMTSPGARLMIFEPRLPVPPHPSSRAFYHFCLVLSLRIQAASSRA